jgi:hypothetical protein
MAPPCLAIPFLAGVSDLNSEGRAGIAVSVLSTN